MNETAALSPDASVSRPMAWATWRATLLLTLGVLAVRVAYLALFCPYEVVADEAHYWDWSRHLSLSYYSKGPGVGWTIFASTRAFGDAAWAIRLPAALATAITMLAAAGLTSSCADDDPRPGFFAALLVALAAPFTAAAQFMTIDAPFFACWLLAAWAAWSVHRAAGEERSVFGRLLLLAAALGVGFLYKYTILLLVPGLAIFAWIDRRHLARASRAQWLAGLAVGVVVFAVCISPVLIWNTQQGWPTVRHLLGHVNAPGGDVQRVSRSYDPMWTVQMVGEQLGIVGPPLASLLIGGVILARRRRDREPSLARAAAFAFSCATPVWLFYLGVSFVTDVEANWPVPAYLTLTAPAAMALVSELARYRRLVRDWLAMPEPRPREGLFRRKPETFWQVAWHWTLGWGIVAWIGIMFAPYAADLPLLREFDGKRRIAGHAARAQRVDEARQQLAAETRRVPLVITDYYTKTSLLAYYLPDQPAVYCAASRMGTRQSAYDQFADTNLDDPALVGRPAILLGNTAERWQNTLGFEKVVRVSDDERLFAGYGYRLRKAPTDDE
jgi:hypothetical protein